MLIKTEAPTTQRWLLSRMKDLAIISVLALLATAMVIAPDVNRPAAAQDVAPECATMLQTFETSDPEAGGRFEWLDSTGYGEPAVPRGMSSLRLRGEITPQNTSEPIGFTNGGTVAVSMRSRSMEPDDSTSLLYSTDNGATWTTAATWTTETGLSNDIVNRHTITIPAATNIRFEMAPTNTPDDFFLFDDVCLTPTGPIEEEEEVVEEEQGGGEEEEEEPAPECATTLQTFEFTDPNAGGLSQWIDSGGYSEPAVPRGMTSKRLRGEIITQNTSQPIAFTEGGTVAVSIRSRSMEPDDSASLLYSADNGTTWTTAATWTTNPDGGLSNDIVNRHTINIPDATNIRFQLAPTATPDDFFLFDDVCLTPNPVSSPGEYTQVIQMGDSYSAGVGTLSAAPPALPAFGHCRNPHYFNPSVTPGIRIAKDIEAEPLFASCVGAEAEGENYLQRALSDQVDYLLESGRVNPDGADTLIVYTIGGNDLRMGGLSWPSQVINCVMPVTDCNTVPSGDDWTDLEETVRRAHENVLNSFPQADIRVMGYPYMFSPTEEPEQVGYLCGMTQPQIGEDGPVIPLSIMSSDVESAQDSNEMMNDKLRAVVTALAQETGRNIEYVDVASDDRPGACAETTGGNHVNGIVFGRSDVAANSFHPTVLGYEGFYVSLAENLGLTPQVNTADPGTEICQSTSATPGDQPDPWGPLVGSSINVRAPSVDGVLNNALFTKDVTTLDIIIDTVGPAAGEANLEIFVELSGALGGALIKPAEAYCYDQDTGENRGYYTATVPLQVNDPSTSIVARLLDPTGDVLGTSHSAVYSVDAINDEPTVEAFGLRIDFTDQVHADLRTLIRSKIQQGLDGPSDIRNFLRVFDTSSLQTDFAAIPGGFRASASLSSLNTVVDFDLLGDNCVLAVNFLLPDPLVFSMDFSFNNDAEIVADMISFEQASVSSTTAEIGSATRIEGGLACVAATAFAQILDLFNVEVDLLKDTLTSNSNLEGVANALIDNWLGSIEWLDPNYEIAGLQGFKLYDYASIGTIGADANGLFATVEMTLPGAAVEDAIAPPISSLVQQETEGGQALANMVVGTAFINRLLLATRWAPGFIGDGLTLPVDELGLVVSASFVGPARVDRRPPSETCGGLCIDIVPSPIVVTIRDASSPSTDPLEHPILQVAVFTPDGPLSTAGSFNNDTGDVTLAATTLPNFTGSVLWDANASTNLSPVPDAILAGLLSEVGTGVALTLPGIDEFSIGGAGQVALEWRPNITIPDNPHIHIAADLTLVPDLVDPICNGATATTVGSQFDDVLVGSGASNSMAGGGGNDYLNGKSGNDTLCGGAGDDIIRAGNGDDFLSGGDGNDNLRGNLGSDTMNGGGGNDLMRGSLGNDTMNGGDGFDRMWGGSGDDTMNGGDGTDRMWGDSGRDTMNAGNGNDFLYGGTGRDVMHGNDGNDQLSGQGNRDTMYGDDGDDRMWGNGSKDTMNGGTGNDLMWGGGARDTMNGGSGDDRMWGNGSKDTMNGGSGFDYGHGGPASDSCSSFETEVSC